MSKTIQIRKKGTITLPAEFRKRYQLHEDDPITLIDLDEGIFLSPKPSVLPSRSVGTGPTSINFPALSITKIFFESDAVIAGSASQQGASFILLQLSELGLIEGVISQK